MAHHHRLAVSTLYDRRYDVAKLELDISVRMVSAGLIHDVFVQSAGLGGGGGQMDESVPSIDIQHGGNGPNAMGWIEIAVTVNGMECSPLGLAETFFTKFHTAAIRLLSIVKFNMPKVVLISTLQMEQFAKKSLPNHV